MKIKIIWKSEVIFRPQSAETIVSVHSNERPGILPVILTILIIFRFWENHALRTHLSSRAGGEDYGSF